MAQEAPYEFTEYGDARYYAPERNKQMFDLSDVFSAGLVFYEMAEGEEIPPYGNGLYYDLRHNSFELQRSVGIVKNVITKCLDMDPMTRISAEEAKRMMAYEE